MFTSLLTQYSAATWIYDESCDPSPRSPYGAAKAAAEVAVASMGDDAAIVRTSWILGDGRSEFENLVASLATGKTGGALFDDDIRCPVHVADLAEAVVELCGMTYRGVIHTAGAEAMSRHELGCLIAERDGYDPGALPKASRSSIADTGTTIRLDSTRAGRLLNTRLRGAHEFAANHSP